MRFFAPALLSLYAFSAYSAVDLGGGVRYLSGGVGEDERARIESEQGAYDIKVLLADTTGHLVGEADIQVLDSEGGSVLATTTDGPILLIDLPPGSYTIEAMAEGKLQRRNVHVDGSGVRNIQFTWQGITDRDGLTRDRRAKGQMSAR